MTGSATIKLKSQNGASFSFALLLFLVCAVVSSVVLAASTASMGQFAGQGKADQRYYAVTSAAGLFSDAFGESGELQYTLTETCRGTRTITRPQAGAATETFAKDKGASNAELVAPAYDEGYDFLSDATAYALFGHPSSWATQANLSSQLAEASWGTWLLSTAAKDDDTGLPKATASTATFKVSPDIPGVDPSETAYDVTVDATLNDDWTCDLYFHNDAADSNDRFYLYMKLSAIVEEGVAVSEQLQGSTASTDDGTVNEELVSETKTTTVTWHVERVVPGRGPVSGS